MGKQLSVYITGGIRPDWTDLTQAMVDSGADLVEVGIPFSDPMLDGRVIQEASQTALDRGATFDSVLADTAKLELGVPTLVMTYANHAFSRGLDDFCERLVESRVDGAILPDLPFDEAGDYLAATARAGLDAVLMVTPSTPEDQVARVCQASRGFIYTMSVMATTGATVQLGQPTWDVVARAKAHTALPVLVGFGIDGPRAAAQACEHADGVLLGAAVMRRVLDGASPAELGGWVKELREAIDQAG